LAKPVITEAHLTPSGGSFSEGDIVINFTGSGVSISEGNEYYEIDGLDIKLTNDGATLVNTGAAFPTLTLTDSNGSSTLYSQRFAMSDDISVGYAAKGKVLDKNVLLARTHDATSTSPPHFASYLKSEVTGIASTSGDKVIHAKLNLFIANSKNAESGKVALYALNNNDWTKDSITYANRPYTASSPSSNGALDTALSHDFGSQDVSTTDGKIVSYDISSINDFNDSLSFLILSADTPNPDASGTLKQGSRRHYFHSSEASDNSHRPYIAISYIRNTVETPTTIDLTVKEGSNSLLEPSRLVEQTTTKKILSVNGTAWESLDDSTHDTYVNEFDYKQVAGSHGTLYLRNTGLAYYVHDGSDLDSDVTDSFTYETQAGNSATISKSFTIEILAGNQAPKLTLHGKNFNPKSNKASAGDVAASYSVTDPDGDITEVYWLTDDGRPPSHNGSALYELDRKNSRVILTSAGADRVNALEELSPVPLTAYDNGSESKSCYQTAHPYVAIGRTFYVDKANGDDDSNDGLSKGSAFATIEKVLNKVKGNQFLQAGDTVYVVGEYSTSDFNESYVYGNNPSDPYIWRNEITTIKIREINGIKGKPITFKAWDHNTVVKSDDTACISVDKSTYIRIIGFEAIGTNERMGNDTALALQFLYRVDNTKAGYDRADYDIYKKTKDNYDYYYRVPKGSTAEEVKKDYSTENTLKTISDTQRPVYLNTKGILVKESQYVDVLHNKVHHTQSTGIRAQGSEYVRIINNEVHNCSRKASVGTMGIVARETTNNIDVKTNKSNLYKIVIANNIVHHNYNEMFSWIPTKTFMNPHLDEGKGISLEWQNHPSWVEDGKKGRILISNNITYLNGLSGVNCHGSGRVDVISNTSHLNSLYSTIFELDSGSNRGITHEPGSKNSVDLGTDVRFWNNLSVADSNGSGYALRMNKTSKSVTEGFLTYDGEGNLVWDYLGREVKRSDENIADGVFLPVADPMFIDPANADFRLNKNSPAKDVAKNLGTGWKLPDFMDQDSRYLTRTSADVGGLEQITPLTGFEAWLQQELSINDYNTKQSNSAEDDFDGDGVSNLLEYAFGTSPNKSDYMQYIQRVPRLTELENGEYHLKYALPQTPRIDLNYEVQKSLDLMQWLELSPEKHTITEKTSDSLLWRTWENVSPEKSAAEAGFFRLKVTRK